MKSLANTVKGISHFVSPNTPEAYEYANKGRRYPLQYIFVRLLLKSQMYLAGISIPNGVTDNASIAVVEVEAMSH